MANENYEPRVISHLRPYVLYRTVYEMEPYLHLVKNPKYRITISKMRTRSHKLEIERGRYTRPITQIEQRVCLLCKVVKDEFHFMLQCYRYTWERRFVIKIQAVGPLFEDLLSVDKLAYLMTSNINIGRQICPQFIRKARKLYATVRDDTFCIVVTYSRCFI